MTVTKPLRRGDVVRVRSAAEVLATLDETGATDRLPFMPEMLPLLGRTFTVGARADKTCDSVDLTGCSREMDDTVHLSEGLGGADVRCDGSAHGGCQAGCTLFLKDAWLERVDSVEEPPAEDDDAAADEPALEELRERLAPATMVGPDTYRCQATALPEASRPMRGLTHYLNDVRHRNVVPQQAVTLVRNLALTRLDQVSERFGARIPVRTRDRLRSFLDRAYPDLRGPLRRTPVESLDLEIGELVEVRSLPEIVATLDGDQRNRNLWFDREMVRYCGQQLRVVGRVDRLLDEKTGRMITMKTPGVILGGAVCLGDFHKLCPRRTHVYFREIWLRRVDADAEALESA